MEAVNFIKQVDFFRKVNQDIETHTKSGGIFSIVAALCGILLVMTEVKDFKKFEMVSEMQVDHDFDGDFQVNLNVTFLKAPCSVLSVDLEDELGTHTMAVHQNLTFVRVDKDNNILPPLQNAPQYNGSEQQVKDLSQAVQNGEQCNVYGHFEAKKTPGNFHFSFHKHGDLVSRLFRTDQNSYFALDVDFRIEHLYFGSIEISEIYKQRNSKFSLGSLFSRKFNILSRYNIPDEAVDPYNGLTFTNEGKHDYENHLSILPVQLDEGNNTIMQIMSQISKQKQQVAEVYQYNIYSGSLAKNPQDIPVAYFRYRMNPVNITYRQQKKSFYHLIVNLLAIVGGIFALIGVLNSGLQACISYAKNMQNQA